MPPEVHKSPRLIKLDDLELPVGRLYTWNDWNGFDDNLEASKILAKVGHQRAYAAHLVFIISSSEQRCADNQCMCSNAEELVVRHVARKC